MDYVGQGRAEFWSQFIILVFTVSGTLWAYLEQRFSLALYCHAAGFVIACVLCLPPWPFYSRHPLKWQKPCQEDYQQQPPIPPPASKSGKSKR
ncbi:Signal peptidase complex subunit 1, partial [Fragariocoptes setiger]